MLQQQARFDAFVARYNEERPHQALGTRVPAAVRICFQRHKVNLSVVLAGHNVGVLQVGEHVWLVTFMQYDLGYFDDETCQVEPIEHPFDPKVLPMCSE